MQNPAIISNPFIFVQKTQIMLPQKFEIKLKNLIKKLEKVIFMPLRV